MKFNARCTRSFHPRVLLVGDENSGNRQRYFDLSADDAVALAIELMESAQTAYAMDHLQQHRRHPRRQAPPLLPPLMAEDCHGSPADCRWGEQCFCRRFPINTDQVKQLCELRKILASMQLQRYWTACVSVATQEEIPAATPVTTPQAEAALTTVE